MFSRIGFTRLSGLCLLAAITASIAHADTLVKITSAGSQGGNDSLSWSQKGADQTVLPTSFAATTALSNSVTVGLTAPNSIVSVVCAATPCSWTGTGFTAGHSLLWTSDAGNGGSGPVTLTFGTNVSGAGATIQANAPGAFTAQIQLFNGATSLGSFTQASDAAGDPLYLGAIDQTAANVTKVVFSLTTCSGLCTDFGVDTVAVNGSASTATVTVSPGSLTFPSTVVGSTSASQTVTLTNTGSTVVSITSIASSGSGASSFLIPSKTCGATLAVGANCTFTVAFKPTTTGALSAVILVTDSATGSPQQVNVSGTGQSVAPTVTLTPSSLTFPTTTVGSTSASQTVTLKNTGSTTLNITSILSSGTNASSFLVPTNGCGSTLTAGSSCTFTVAFKPTASGALSGSIQVTDNATGSPQSVTVSGTGQAAGSTLTFTPSSLSFPTTTVGSSSATQVVTLKNTGTTAITLSSAVSSGTNASSFLVANQTCTANLAAGASCNVGVTFKPTTTGALSAVVLVTDSAPGSPQSVPVSGTGQSALTTVTLTPGSMTFATTTVGSTSASQTATLTNTGSTVVNITSIVPAGTNASSFLVPTNTCGSTLAVGANCSFTVAFKPTASGALSGSIQVTDNATGSPQSVTVSGTGQAAGSTITLTPSSLTFPTTTVGSSSATQVVTLKNTGTTAITLSSAVSSGTNASSFLVANQTCTANLAAGASCNFGVTFKPTTTGALSAVVLVTDSASGSPQSVPLSGTGN